jgi:sugar-specific transcriptional regulator TrmB
MELEKELENLGISEKEAKIYLLLARSNALTATEISRITNINRRSVYDALDSLSSQGLCNYSINEKKKLFRANDLALMGAQLDEKKQLLAEIIPKIEKISSKSESDPVLRVLTGKNAMKAVFEEIINAKSQFLVYGGAMQSKDLLKYYYPQWTKKREKEGVKLKGIFVDMPGVREYVKTLPLAQYKFIEKDYLSPAIWWLQGNKIYQVFFQENPIIISIESANMAKTYRHSFELIWKRL